MADEIPPRKVQRCSKRDLECVSRGTFNLDHWGIDMLEFVWVEHQGKYKVDKNGEDTIGHIAKNDSDEFTFVAYAWVLFTPTDLRQIADELDKLNSRIKKDVEIIGPHSYCL